MRKNKYIKFGFLAGLVLFILAGLFLKSRNAYYTDERVTTQQSIQIDSTHTIAQKILGDDHYVQSFKVFIKDKELFDDSKLIVYLTKESRDLSESNIISQITLTADSMDEDNILCEFSESRLRYNRDYYIVFQYIQNDDKGYIQLYINKDDVISPVYLNDMNTGVSLAYCLHSISHKTQLSFIWEFAFIFLSYMMAYSIFRKKNIAHSFSVVVLLLSLFVYALALIGLLKYCAYLCFGIACLCMIYVIVKVVHLQDKHFQTLFCKENFWQFFCWGILFILCIVGNRGKCVIESDPFVHWGMVVQNIYMFDSLPFHEQSNLVAYRYPPLYSLFQYFCMKIYGNWSESILYFAKDFLLGSIIIGSCFRKHIKNAWGVIFALALGIGMPELFFPADISASIYVDEVLGVVFGYTLISLYRVFYVKEKCVGELFIALLSLGLMKESGLILGMILLFSTVLIYVVEQMKAKSKLKMDLRKYGIGLLAIILAYVSWHIYMALHVNSVTSSNVSNNNNIVAASGVNSNGIIEYILGKAPSYKYDIIKIHLQKLFFEGYYDNAFWSMTFVGWLLIILLTIYCLMWISRKEMRINIKVMWLLIICALLYIGFLHIVYTFTMTEREALLCASEARYLGSFLLGSFMLLLYMYITQIETSKLQEGKKVVAYVLIASFVLVVTNQCMFFRQEITDKEKIYDYTQNIRNDSHKLRYFLEEGDKFFYLADMENVANYMYYNYDLLPIRSECYGFPVDESIWEPVYDLTVDELRDKMDEYEYVYIRTTRKLFAEKYGELFVDPNNIEDGSLYRKREDGLLVKIY